MSETRSAAFPPPRPPRFGRRGILGAFVGLLALVLGAALTWIWAVAPEEPAPPCVVGRPCSDPPQEDLARVASDPHEPGRAWRSGTGAVLRYDPAVWRVRRAGTRELSLIGRDGGHIALLVRAVPSAERAPSDLLEEQVERESRDKLAMAPDLQPEHALLGPSIGSVEGAGAVYTGVPDLYPSPWARVQMMFIAASDGRSSVLVEVSTDADPAAGDGVTTPFPIFEQADRVLASFRWSE
ncbi:MAG: hypothetical protein ACRDQ2_00310 [Gaiellales bacterium]